MSDAPDNRDMEVHETFSIAPEFAPSVTVTEETFFEHGWQPLTICVLQAIWFLPTDASFDVGMLVDWFKQLGWKSANGKPLGPDAMRRELGLIRKAGYINAARLQGEGGRMVGIHYTVSKRRSNSPQDGIPVRPANQENRRSRHVPSFTTHGGSPHVVDDGRRRSNHVPPLATRGESPRVANDRSLQVAPCASNGVHPPHPPEGGGTTSPSPQKTGRASKAEKWATACALDAEDYQPTTEEITAADAFLQDLPGKWQMGVDEARALAPLLASRVHTQGHELDTYLELVLIQDDPNDPARVPARVMPVRIRGLKRKRTEGRPLPPQAAGSLAPWCGECNGGEEPREVFQRFREMPDGTDVPCQACHPKHARPNS